MVVVVIVVNCLVLVMQPCTKKKKKEINKPLTKNEIYMYRRTLLSNRIATRRIVVVSRSRW